MNLALMLEWWNLIYVIPFGLAIIYLALYVFTGITFGDADADAELSAEADAAATVQVEAHVVDSDMDANVDADADGDLDGDAEIDHDADVDTHAESDNGSNALVHAHAADHAGHGSAFSDLLSFLGMGKIPLSLALMILLLCWGVTGMMLNSLIFKWLGATAFIVVFSFPLALGLSVGFTGLAAALIGKIIPNDDGARQRRQDLVGRAGEAIFDIDATFGMAGVRGSAGDLFQVPCRTAEGKPRIPKGSRVVLFNYDRDEGVFQVAPFDA